MKYDGYVNFCRGFRGWYGSPSVTRVGHNEDSCSYQAWIVYYGDKGVENRVVIVSVLNKNGFTDDEVSEIEAAIGKAVRDTFQVDAEGGFAHVICKDNLPNVASDLKSAIESFPESIDLHAHLSLALVRQGKGQDAAAHMEEQAKKHPDNADWQIAYAGTLMTSPELSGDFNDEAERIYSMDLTSEQKMTLNQYVAAVGEPPREVDNRSELLKRTDKALAKGVDWLFGLDND